MASLPKILLTGASGLLGQALLEQFSGKAECIGIGRSKPVAIDAKQWHTLDLLDEPAVHQAITRVNPDVAIHCAAMSDVDACEKNPDAAFKANGIAVRNVALACQRFDTPLMAISTDYVFDGVRHPADGYREFDATNPISEYGKSKLWGESWVQQLLRRYWIVRTSWLFGPGRATFIDKILAASQNGSKIPCVRDMVSSPTYTVDLANAIERLISGHAYGVYHLSNQGFCSRVELAKFVLNQVEASEICIQPMLQSELNLPALRPAFSAMKNWMWEQQESPLPSWKQSVAAYLSTRVQRQ